MSKYAVVASLLAACLLVSVPAFALPSPDELLKMMADKQDTAKTMQADTVSTFSTPQGPMKGTGKIYTSRTEVDGKPLYKSNTTMKMTMEAEGVSMTMDSKTVNDGLFVWHEMRNSMMPMVMVVKTRAGQTVPGQGPAAGPDDSIEQMKKEFNFTRVGEDTIDGRKMYVLEGTPRVAQRDNPLATVKYYIDQEQFYCRRMIMLEQAGKEMGRFDLTNIKLNSALDPKLFEYTPPPGARVQDMTGAKAGK